MPATEGPGRAALVPACFLLVPDGRVLRGLSPLPSVPAGSLKHFSRSEPSPIPTAFSDLQTCPLLVGSKVPAKLVYFQASLLQKDPPHQAPVTVSAHTAYPSSRVLASWGGDAVLGS